MKEENQYREQSMDKRYKRRAINQLAVGFIIVLWGGLLMLKQVGVMEKDVSTWPFAFVAFGVLLVIGGIYRLRIQEK